MPSRLVILGTESAGKTVLIATLTHTLTSTTAFPRITCKDQGTRRYVAEIIDKLETGEWPPSTAAGKWKDLRWCWHDKEKAEHELRTFDCAGQDFREIFEAESESELNADQKKLRDKIFGSDLILMLFNFHCLLDIHKVAGRQQKRIDIEDIPALAIRKLREKNITVYVVFTQADLYQERVEMEWKGDYKAALKEVSPLLYNALNDTGTTYKAVSCVDTEVREGKRVPKKQQLEVGPESSKLSGLINQVEEHFSQERKKEKEGKEAERRRQYENEAAKRRWKENGERKVRRRKVGKFCLCMLGIVLFFGLLFDGTRFLYERSRQTEMRSVEAVRIASETARSKRAREEQQRKEKQAAEEAERQKRVSEEARKKAEREAKERQAAAAAEAARQFAENVRNKKPVSFPLSGDVSLELLPIPAGSFMMGSPADEPGRYNDEARHEVRISKPYWMGKHEVTQAQWEAVMGNNPSQFKGAKLPVENVTWDEAIAFCKKLTEQERAAGRLPEGYSYTLPTEAEWEYACRAGTTTPFSTGNNLTTEQGNYDGNYPYNGNTKGKYRERTTEVGSFPANAFGLCDMHGNVWEWCRGEWYGGYSTGSATAPMGARADSIRVMRGGSLSSSARSCRSAFRSWSVPSYRGGTLGFRVALCSVAEEGGIRKSEGMPDSNPVRQTPPESSGIASETRTVSLANDIKLDLVRVAAGKFMMGSSDDEPERYWNELQDEVTISKPYWMGKYEVTQAQWEAVMGNNPSQFKGAKLPVENVSWEEAMVFCKKLTEQERAAGRLPEGYRYTLPTEAEWEYACRAGMTTPFSTGNNFTAEQGNYDGRIPYNGNAKGEYRERTTEVGSFPANALGLYDMHGNVGELCRDWDGAYPTGSVTDPTGSARIARGGSWYSNARSCRSAFRAAIEPDARNNTLGFRVALSSVVGGGD